MLVKKHFIICSKKKEFQWEMNVYITIKNLWKIVKRYSTICEKNRSHDIYHSHQLDTLK